MISRVRFLKERRDATFVAKDHHRGVERLTLCTGRTFQAPNEAAGAQAARLYGRDRRRHADRRDARQFTTVRRTRSPC